MKNQVKTIGAVVFAIANLMFAQQNFAAEKYQFAFTQSWTD